jgi:thioredoxin 1
MTRRENMISFIGTKETLTGIITQSEGLVLLNFTADWCGTCRSVSQKLATLADQHADVKFIKINVDLNREVAVEFGVRSVPHVVATRGVTSDGKVNVLHSITGMNMKALAEVVGKYK